MKKYFEKDAEWAFTKADHLKNMQDVEDTEREVYEAKPDYGSGFFFCREFETVGEVGEDCGRFCPKYEPRNKKNGRCRFSGYTYLPTEKKITLKIKT